jgi:hypothetical protein
MIRKSASGSECLAAKLDADARLFPGHNLALKLFHGMVRRIENHDTSTRHHRMYLAASSMSTSKPSIVRVICTHSAAHNRK